MSQVDDGCSTSIVDNKRQRSLPVSPAPSGLEIKIAWKEAEAKQQAFSTAKGPL